MSVKSLGNLVVDFREQNFKLHQQLSAVTKERDELKQLLRIWTANHDHELNIDNGPIYRQTMEALGDSAALGEEQKP